MSLVNNVTLYGNLGADPEVRYTADGTAIANLRLATSEFWKDKDGVKKESTEWHRVVFFGPAAETLGKHAVKGAALHLRGRIRTRKWTDKEGVEKYTTEIVGEEFRFGPKRAETGDDTPPQPAAAGDFDDDIPF